MSEEKDKISNNTHFPHQGKRKRSCKKKKEKKRTNAEKGWEWYMLTNRYILSSMTFKHMHVTGTK